MNASFPHKLNGTKLVLWLFVILLLSTLIASCTPTPQTPEATSEEPTSLNTSSPSGGTIVVGMATDSIVTLDPAAYSDRSTETVIRNIFDGLVTRTTDNRVVLEIAQAYRWVDEKTIEFDLKQDVFFHNGETLTAEDVVFTVERILYQEIGGPRQVFLKEVESVEKVEDYTVRFNLTSPWPVFLQMLVHVQIVPKDYLTEIGNAAFAENPVGSGPFEFVEGNLDDQVILKRFEEYYGGADELFPVGPANLDSAIFRFIPDVDDRVAALQSGEVHIVQNLTSNLVSELSTDPNIIIKTAVGTRPKFIDLNVTAPPFDDVRVRQALNYAVDAQTILNEVAGGFGIILPGPLSPANLYADPSLQPYGYDPDKAKTLLSEAEMNPEDISFSLDAYGSYVQIAEAVAAQLQAFGMDVTVSTREYADVKPMLLNCERQAFLRDWGDSAFDPVGYIEAKWQTQLEGTPAGRGNFACYSNPMVDELIEAGASEPDETQRAEIYNELQQILVTEAPAIFLYVPQEVEAAASTVNNWEPSPDGRINLHDVWLKEN